MTPAVKAAFGRADLFVAQWNAGRSPGRRFDSGSAPASRVMLGIG